MICTRDVHPRSVNTERAVESNGDQYFGGNDMYSDVARHTTPRNVAYNSLGHFDGERERAYKPAIHLKLLGTPYQWLALSVGII